MKYHILRRYCGWLLLVPLFSTQTTFALQVPTLADPAWLQQQLDAPGLRLIEVSDLSSYEFDGHIPGSISLPGRGHALEDSPKQRIPRSLRH